MLRILFSNPLANANSVNVHFGALLLRAGIGLMMAFGHGWPMFTNFTEIAPGFPDPIGIGSNLSLSLAIFAEWFCSILLVLGFMTRLATVPLILTMLVAILGVHAGEGFAEKEKALLYLSGYLVLAGMGAGRSSLDQFFGERYIHDASERSES